MAALLKKYPTLAREQSPFKLLSDMERMIKKERDNYKEFHANPNADKSHIKFYTRKCASTNVPIDVGSLDEMYDEMREAVRTMSGINFVLGMQTDDGKYQVWRRPNQPCQGGEMRKYGITHDDSTRPLDRRPGDLTHPFPDGKPIAVGSKLEYAYKSFEHQVHPLSVYRRAYGVEDNVEKVMNKKGDKVHGLLIRNADLVDPTILVHMFRDARNWGGEYDGLSPQAAFLLRRANSYGICWSTTINPDNEHSAAFFNAKAIGKGGVEAASDLTGGSLGNRFDYNRPEIEFAFKGKVGENVSFYQFFNEAVFEGKPSTKSFYVDKKFIKEFGPKVEAWLKKKSEK